MLPREQNNRQNWRYTGQKLMLRAFTWVTSSPCAGPSLQINYNSCLDGHSARLLILVADHFPVFFCSRFLRYFRRAAPNATAAPLPSGRVIWVGKWSLLQFKEDSSKTILSRWIVTPVMGHMALIMQKLKDHFGNLELWSVTSSAATGAAITEHKHRTCRWGKGQ